MIHIHRTPRVDLRAARDVLHLLKHRCASVAELERKIILNIDPPQATSWKSNTIAEYVKFIREFGLTRRKKGCLELTPKGKTLVRNSEFGEPSLSTAEIREFRKIVRSFTNFNRLISCLEKMSTVPDQAIARGDIPTRSDLVEYLSASRMRPIGDAHRYRDIRTLLYWARDLKYIEEDDCLPRTEMRLSPISLGRKGENSPIYLITNDDKKITFKEFFEVIRRIYRNLSRNERQLVTIPALRAWTCVALKISRIKFDTLLLNLYYKGQYKIHLGRASALHPEVEECGIMHKEYSYFYVSL